jgi:hypothetical protein
MARKISKAFNDNKNDNDPPYPPDTITIYLDMDGVVADFDGHAKTAGKQDGQGKPKYNELDRAWYASMPATEGAKDFYDAAKKLGVVKFLTGPIMNPDCFSGKADWVMKFVPEAGRNILGDLIIAHSKDKQYLAKPRRILIDDRIQNINQWIAEGGIGIHHKGDFAETLKELQKVVAELKAAKPAAPQKKRGMEP